MADRACVRRVPERRRDLLTFEVLGQLDAEDMRYMADQVEQAFERRGKIDMLILFRRFEGATAGAVVEPHALRVELASIAHVRRYGVVGAPGWADAMIALGGWVTPIESKTFDIGEDAAARAWIDRSEG
ncbi:SpoIIAA family protein [Brevundimonas bacteroides]|uniref:STAS/SEC14 domain-containing protein n=1 Tax=Brevundimonas bacteroides TaxID=74311 RepID=UPI00068F9999|nr:STAS/SEC14 domain-containing protein [Brevundimonas bacteroides]